MAEGWKRLITSYARKSASGSNPAAKIVIRNGKIVKIASTDEKECSEAKGRVPTQSYRDSFRCEQKQKRPQNYDDNCEESNFSKVDGPKQKTDSGQLKLSKADSSLGKYTNFGEGFVKNKILASKKFKNTPDQQINSQKTSQLSKRNELRDMRGRIANVEDSFHSEYFLSDPNIEKENFSELKSFQNTTNDALSIDRSEQKTTVTGRYINSLISHKMKESEKGKDADKINNYEKLNTIGIPQDSQNVESIEFATDPTKENHFSLSHVSHGAKNKNPKTSSFENSEFGTHERKTLSVSHENKHGDSCVSITQIPMNTKPAIPPRIIIKMEPPGIIVISPSSKSLCDILSAFPRQSVVYDPKTGVWNIDPRKYADIKPLIKKNFRFQDIPPGLLTLYLQFHGCKLSPEDHISKPTYFKKDASSKKKPLSSKNREYTDKKQENTNREKSYVFPENISEQHHFNCKTGNNDYINHTQSDFQRVRGIYTSTEIPDANKSLKGSDLTQNNHKGLINPCINPLNKASNAIKNEIINFSTFQYLKVPLLDFQRTAVTQAIAWGGRILLADEMGLGKTLQALACALHYRAEWPCLVLAPASLVGSWVQAFSEFAGIEAIILKDKTDFSESVYVCSYDLAAKIFKFSSQTIRVVIADEAHFLKNPRTNRCSSLLSILQKANRLFLLSGTPATSRPCELFTSLIALRPKAFKSFKEFGERYCGGVQKGKYADWKGCTHSTELLFFLKEIFMIRRTKADVLSELPVKSRVQVVLGISKKDSLSRNTHPANTAGSLDGAQTGLDLQQNLLKYIAEASMFAKKLNKVEKLDKNIIQMYNEAAELKLSVVLKYLKKFLKKNIKTVIFAQHHIMLNAIQESLEQIKHIRIDGKTPVHARQKLVQNFQSDPEIQVALLSITTCGTGLTLTAATAAIFTELYWNPGTLLQAEDRIHRIGQTKAVTIYYLTATHTVDEVVWPLLTKKMAVLEKCGVGTNEFKDIRSDDAATKITDFCTIEKYDSTNDP